MTRILDALLYLYAALAALLACAVLWVGISSLSTNTADIVVGLSTIGFGAILLLTAWLFWRTARHKTRSRKP